MAKFKKEEVVVESDLSQDPSLRDELYELAVSYGEADASEKLAKKSKDVARGPMLELMTAVVREEIPLATDIVVVTDDEAKRYDFDWRLWCSVTHPGWRVIAIAAEEGQTTITVEEDESFKRFEFVVDGKKYGRTVALVDAEFLAEDFYREVLSDEDGLIIENDDAAVAALNCIKVETIEVFTLDEDAAEQAIADYPELVPVFQRHSTPGKPQVRMMPITTVKETT